MRRGAGALAVVISIALTMAVPASGNQLRAGAGRADITPATGYTMGGWIRSEIKSRGQHTRLFARAIVLERDGRKIALVATDLVHTTNGMLVEVAERLRDRGIGERDLIVSASHTHSGPSGYMNFQTFNTAFPSRRNPTELEIGGPDRQLYSFLVRRLTAAIRRADDDLTPARAGWGETELLGTTQNRSIEAHLNGHGQVLDRGAGNASLDPEGYRHTIDPEVHVLRVDKTISRKVCRRRRARPRRRRCRERTVGLPIGAWSTFSNHGTVNKPTFPYYQADHHGAANRVFEAAVRDAGRVPAGQEVVNAYGNTDEGDTSAGINHTGPAGADEVGREEAGAMLRAWRQADLSKRPILDLRWTRVCFCGQRTAAGRIDDTAVQGLPVFTGSEENRGPLNEETGAVYEGRTSPVSIGPQGRKIPAVVPPPNTVPMAVPLTAARIGDVLIVTVPAEMTSGMGRLLRAAVLREVRGHGIRRVVISGLANEFIQYLASPKEYDRQHYEGGSTLYGRASSIFLQERLVDLGRRLAEGRPAVDPYEFDSRNEVRYDGEPYGRGATSGTVSSQPGPVRRLRRATFGWDGGPRGLDRPLDRPFVTVQRSRGGRWRDVADDLGLEILWTVDANGRYAAHWEVPRTARRGIHRFVVTANRYRLVSRRFLVSASTALRPRLLDMDPGRATVVLEYPRAVADRDLTWRPRHARGGRIVFRVDGKRKRVRRKRGRGFTVRGRPGALVEIRDNAARDRRGNRNHKTVRFGLR
jgi:neutral ceramidase